ncbi:MAG: PspA/IM30 family protein [Deltaproteobacteria bacterium]|nr:PspA/IM30 family protein [Deltaproteobacteria bacterium]
MGVLDGLRDLLGRSVADLVGSHEDPDALLAQALTEMERELTAARLQADAATREATHARELHELRREEARVLGQRADEAEADGLPEEAARQRTARDKALHHAGVLEAEAGRSETTAAQVREAVGALERLAAEATARQREVRERLAELRRARADRPRPQVGERPPPPSPPGERTREAVERDFDHLEARSAVEDRLAELKKRAGK